MFQPCLHEYACNVTLIYCMPYQAVYIWETYRLFNAMVTSLLLCSVPFLKLLGLYPLSYTVSKQNNNLSRCDLTILLYNITKVGVTCLKLRLIKPSVIYATLILSFMSRPPGIPVREFPGIRHFKNSRREFPGISEFLAKNYESS